jgi:hypothetical protein
LFLSKWRRTCGATSEINFNHDQVNHCRLKPVTHEQVFYDKFLCDKFYLPKCTCENATNFIWQVFICQVLFTGLNVSEKGVYRRQDRKIIVVRLPITSNAQITLTSFLCWPIQTNKICTLTIFYDKCTCSKASMLAFEQVHLS